MGNIAIGGDNPIRIQSMGTVDTNDTDGCVAQAKRIIDAGGELVRFTTQGRREAENMRNISARLKADGYPQPLVADVHFNANVADVAAQYCEKVRINPGNYVDPARTFKHLEYTDEEYQEELKKIETRLVPFIDICKEHHTAVRIGVNHGSLSDRIMSRYGDTPEGIVESCMEFLRIFLKERFDDVVISIKASNTVVMVQTVRLLVKTMDGEDMHYPLHLGVTEAGEGEDGRIKSAVGIGALLTEGIGDTIRVSLSEEPEREIPVAQKLVDLIPECTQLREEAEASIHDDTITLTLDASDWETLQLKASMAVGVLLIDRKAHQLVLNSPSFNSERHPASRTHQVHEDRIYLLSGVRTHALRPATHHRTHQGSHPTSCGTENRYHGMYRQWTRRDGRCRLRLCRCRKRKNIPLSRQGMCPEKYPRRRSR